MSVKQVETITGLVVSIEIHLWWIKVKNDINIKKKKNRINVKNKKLKEETVRNCDNTGETQTK